ncbi:unconventional prefoldin RPB5 interactor-like [Eriocheir sinensis]|uniref:unconventional prefoldin RPB5 interactor-like n=1 Tax=Eriocheir sinensis TaxID=95602 RepID=UPI0021CA1FCC|nr:unconventional prefoldin RPB5 interactor-like [Eriocheir sinensis]XP_050732262.1 unconventional prefoldin RPB5 interactor-like [Eriocheir sinensis]XP_050732263.1 unconventional prefoldin RPB5 interactor-like [Eriocheir sinensis]XP_050732264.1 unconventional prefoldin RPB5 interactor-like [Eriocheir sinensis]XP_050732265.1 unconventional prefoldin RPB5 interactor-like [Eriocheir sinensis]XP_050732266.1 unconventional prefoldin RPB5 interactor-like [Eriocheir sinensis]XP_050732267.1 unconven
MEEGEGLTEGGAGGVGGGGTTTPAAPRPPTPPPPTAHAIRENLANLLELKKAHAERLTKIEEELARLHRYKKDYEHLYKRLKSLPDKTQHEVMVPLGRLALVPGQLVHTNEVLVLLGDNWFAERSARQATEIVRRRIKDCEDKIRSAENNRRIHTSWLAEADELLAGEEGGRVEILEEVTEDEYQKSKEEHRRRVAEEYTRLREAAPKNPTPQDRAPSPNSPPSPPPAPDPFLEGLGEGERQNYEELMRRLDQLELEEMGEAIKPLDEVDEEEEEDDEEDEGIYNKDEEEEEEEEEEEAEGEEKDEERQQIIPSTKTKTKRTKFRRRLHSAEEPGGDVGKGGNGSARAWRRGFGGVTTSMDNTTDTDSDIERSDEGAVGGRGHRLRRRVSWADDIRPLYTIIPNDGSAEVHRIPYTSTPEVPTPPSEDPMPPLTLPLHGLAGAIAEGGEGGIQSPSDLYRVFGGHQNTGAATPPVPHSTLAPATAVPLAPDTPPPRSILKKSKSLPMSGGDNGGGGGEATSGEEGGVGWCCPPKPLDLDEEEEGKGGDGGKSPTPPPPPSPPPKRAHSFKTVSVCCSLSFSRSRSIFSRSESSSSSSRSSRRRRCRTRSCLLVFIIIFLLFLLSSILVLLFLHFYLRPVR